MLGCSDDEKEEESTYTEEEYEEALETKEIKLKHDFTIKRLKAIEDKLSNGLVEKVNKHDRFIDNCRKVLKFFIIFVAPIGTGLAVAYFSGVLW